MVDIEQQSFFEETSVYVQFASLHANSSNVITAFPFFFSVLAMRVLAVTVGFRSR